MPAETQLSVRILPDGEWISTRLLDISGSVWEIELHDGSYDGASPPSGQNWNGNTLLEMKSTETLALGTLLARRGRLLSVLVEHIIDLEKVGRIRDGWRQLQAN